MGYIMKSVYMSKLMFEFPFYLCMGVYKHAGAGEHKKQMRLHLLLMPPHEPQMLFFPPASLFD